MAKADAQIFYDSSTILCSNPQISRVAPFATTAIFSIYDEDTIFTSASDGCRDRPVATGTLVQTVDLSGILPIFLSSEGVKYDYPALVLTTPTIAYLEIEAIVNGATVNFSWYSTYNPADPWPPDPPLTTWVTINNGLAQSIFSMHVADGDILVGCNNNSLTYSPNAVAPWTNWIQLSGSAQTGLSNDGAPIHACTKFNGVWYLFNFQYMSRSAGDTFTFTPVANPPEASDHSAVVLDGDLYVGVYQNDGGANILIRKMITEGAAWLDIDTGITAADIQDTVCGACDTATGAFLFVTNKGKVLRTTDFVSFAVTADTGQTVSYIASVGDVVIMSSGGAGSWIRSADGGLTWGSLQLTPALNELASSDTMFVGSGGSFVFTSADLGLTWQNVHDAFPVTGSAPQGGATLSGITGDIAVLARTSQWMDIGTP